MTDNPPKKPPKKKKEAAVEKPHMGKGKGSFEYGRLSRGMGNPY